MHREAAIQELLTKYRTGKPRDGWKSREICGLHRRDGTAQGKAVFGVTKLVPGRVTLKEKARYEVDFVCSLSKIIDIGVVSLMVNNIWHANSRVCQLSECL